MGYEQSLRQARDLLAAEIGELREQLSHKEGNLRRLESFLKEPNRRGQANGSLTKQIVSVLYELAQEVDEGVPAREVVQAFSRQRDDVNESTIRSTLYQVTRKMRPTEIAVEEGTKQVRVLKSGPLYDVEEVAEQQVNP